MRAPSRGDRDHRLARRHQVPSHLSVSPSLSTGLKSAGKTKWSAQQLARVYIREI